MSKTLDGLFSILALLLLATSAAGEDWLQFKFDQRHSGDAADRRIELPLRLVAAVPATTAISVCAIQLTSEPFPTSGRATIATLGTDIVNSSGVVPDSGKRAGNSPEAPLRTGKTENRA